MLLKNLLIFKKYLIKLATFSKVTNLIYFIALILSLYALHYSFYISFNLNFNTYKFLIWNVTQKRPPEFPDAMFE